MRKIICDVCDKDAGNGYTLIYKGLKLSHMKSCWDFCSEECLDKFIEGKQ